MHDTPPHGYPVIQPPPQQPRQPPPPEPEPAGPWWQRTRNLGIVIAVMGVLLVGAGVGIFVAASARSGEADRELADARADIQRERDLARKAIASERAAFEGERDRVSDEIADLKEDASDARSDARAQKRKLSRLQSQVEGVEQQIEDATVPGDGTFVVGEDIQPGTYKSDGQSGCYWARLSGLGGDLGDIIANDNTDGPVTITVAPSDAALELSGCAEFVRQGG